jgi:hypothetical protein
MGEDIPQPMETVQFIAQINSPEIKDRLLAIKSVTNSDIKGTGLLIDHFQARRAQNLPIDFIDGTIYQTLLKMNDQSLTDAMITGLELKERTIDFLPLFDLLSRSEYQKADVLHNRKMCEAAGQSAADRGWLYFTEVDQISIKDLLTFDRLWLVFSEGKFGYSVQRRIWLNLGKNWEKLWQQIKWKQDGSFTRYPGGFIWTIDAPRGHLPLSNQIRGNRTLEAIFNLLGRAENDNLNNSQFS